jgi:hypothetical protein
MVKTLLLVSCGVNDIIAVARHTEVCVTIRLSYLTLKLRALCQVLRRLRAGQWRLACAAGAVSAAGRLVTPAATLLFHNRALRY